MVLAQGSLALAELDLKDPMNQPTQGYPTMALFATQDPCQVVYNSSQFKDLGEAAMGLVSALMSDHVGPPEAADIGQDVAVQRQTV